MAKITAHVMQTLRRDIDAKMHHLTLSYYDSHTHRRYTQHYSQTTWIPSTIPSVKISASIVTQVTTAVGVLLMMLAISPALTLDSYHHGSSFSGQRGGGDESK